MENWSWIYFGIKVRNATTIENSLHEVKVTIIKTLFLIIFQTSDGNSVIDDPKLICDDAVYRF